ncbi:hypothetical protein C9439_06645 [archaeon SCG-AAA382B04]|nr:hypothetical protein C9439_06645 [archaeon SCG-AAA382B04]
MKKSIIVLFLAFLLVLAAYPASAQDHEALSGKVVDQIDRPIEKQTISIKKLSQDQFNEIKKTQTNRFGEFNIENLEKNKTYLLELKYQGITYSKMVNYPRETNLTFRIQEVSENGIIKGKIDGITDKKEVYLFKDQKEIKKIETDKNYYRFSDLEKGQEYTIKLLKNNITYEKETKTDKDPSNSQIVDFEFTKNLSINIELIGNEEIHPYSIKLSHEGQVVSSEEKETKEVHYTRLLGNKTYKFIINYSDSSYIRELQTDEKSTLKNVRIFTSGEYFLNNSNIDVKIGESPTPTIKIAEKIKIDKTSFLLNNKIRTNYDNGSIVDGELSYSLPNGEIENLTLKSANQGDINYSISNSKLLIEFNDLTVHETENPTFDVNYEVEKTYSGFLSEKITLNREFDQKITRINLTFHIKDKDKHDITKKVQTDFNVSEKEDNYLLNFEDSYSLNLEFEWGTISNLQLLSYSAIILGLAIAIVYSIFIGVIASRSSQKVVQEKEKSDENNLKGRAAESAIKKLEEKYQNGEISKEIYERKKQIYEKMMEEKDEKN